MKRSAARSRSSGITCIGSRALVVAADPDLREVLAMSVETVGCTALEASSVAEARRALAGRVHLLVVDQEMPGTTGLDVLRELRAGGTLPPALLITPSATPAIVAEALLLGAKVLDKPFGLETLCRVSMALILSSRAAERTA
jgi:DNA-binding response OmpR family regulator